MQSKYEVLKIVGEGAYGIVYKCRNKENNEFVAIKKFKETDDEIVKKSMLRELKVLKVIKHENVVEFKEAFKRKDNIFIVLEYVDKNLLELLQEKPKGLDQNLIKNVIFQLCKAIKYLHSLNIIHRDIKPENLLVDSKNQLKLCDFGFARTIKSNGKPDILTDYVATRWYRAPELLISAGNYGPEVDYWAIGCIMGELADGDPLFPGENEVDQLNIIQKILGKIPQDQIDNFYKNPHFSGARLIEVPKPETLERRYMGKLSKTGISFMKSLLALDPKDRLNGENVLNHPYFEGVFVPKIEKNSSSGQIQQSQNTNTSNINLNSFNPNTKLSTEKNNFNQTPVGNNENENQHINNPMSFTKQNFFSNKNQQPIIMNTTNINIINYKMPNEKIKENIAPKQTMPIVLNDKIKFPDEKFSNQNKIKIVPLKTNLNHNNFSKINNFKDNLINYYPATKIDNNFKTFYKGDKYNYDIEVNFRKTFANQKKNIIDEIEFDKKNFGKKQGSLGVNKIRVDGDSHENLNFMKNPENYGKPLKKNFDIILEENDTSSKKISPVNKLASTTFKGFNKFGNLLPNISLKIVNTKLKK